MIQQLKSQCATGRAWKAFTEIGIYERHFNELQSKYRTLSSTWLLATFAGIGFILAKNIGFPGGKYVAASCLATAGAFGIGLLWSIDLKVYHRLLEAVFREALRVERNCTAIPPMRLAMSRLVENQAVPKRCARFYLGGIAVLLTVAASSQVIKYRHNGFLAASIGFFSLIATVHVLAYLWRLTLGRSWRSYATTVTQDVNCDQESLYSFLVEPQKVPLWAGDAIPHIRLENTGAVGWGTEWIVTTRNEDDENVVGHRVVKHYDPPYALTVQLKLNKKLLRRRSYVLVGIGDGTATRLIVEECPASRIMQGILTLAEPFWLLGIPMLVRIRRKKLVVSELTKLKSEAEPPA
ncbi:hypothetical protein OG512_30380 [Streptomyces sp. NBC_01378]|uniref:hypothetical protein n=1 Tax=Streptomyces sp. NBC_01378 TaxID=2903844 RepID=UPI0032514AAC